MASQPIKNVIIAGASGTIGAPVLAALVSNGNFKVSVLSRAESTATFPDNITVKKVDFTSHSALVDALKGEDALICTLNDMAAAIQVPFIEAAVEAGVKRFIPSEWGGHEMTSPIPEMEEGLAGRRAIIDLLKLKVSDAAAEGREFHWTGVDNGVFFDWALQAGFLNIHLPPTKSAMVWDSGNNFFSVTNLATVAAAVVSILSTAEVETRDRFVHIQSFQVSQNSIVQELEKATGAKWEVENTTTEKQLTAAREALEGGDVLSAYYRWLLAGVFSGGKAFAFESGELDNKLLGLKEESFVEKVSELVGN